MTQHPRGEMDEIPEDIRKAAIEVLGRMNMFGPSQDIENIARAIMAERERCASYRDDWNEKHQRLASERPEDADFHNEQALRHRVHAAAIRKGPTP